MCVCVRVCVHVCVCVCVCVCARACVHACVHGVLVLLLLGTVSELQLLPITLVYSASLTPHFSSFLPIPSYTPPLCPSIFPLSVLSSFPPLHHPPLHHPSLPPSFCPSLIPFPLSVPPFPPSLLPSRESDITKERIQKILTAGANVILCTGGIDDLCLKYFVEAGAMAVRRVKTEDMKRIARATGGKNKKTKKTVH